MHNAEDIALPESYLRVRRGVELLAIVCLAPVLLLIGVCTAAAIGLDSRGPLFFRQLRPGKGGRLFWMWKFRSMHAAPEGADFRLTGHNDNRVTRVGHIIRRWRLDELPQFWNIIKGDMSLIGPRPVPENLYARYQKEIPNYDLRHLVRPGITGLAQVRQGYTETPEGERDKWALDMEYIRALSPGMDARVVWETVRTLANGFGAR